MHDISTTAANRRMSGNGRVRKCAHEPLIKGRSYFEIIQIRSSGIPESTSWSEIARKHCHVAIFECSFFLRAAILMDRLHGIDGGLRTRLQEERSSGSRALPGRDTSRNAQHFAAASKALYHTTVHAHARVKRSNLPQLLIYTHGGYVSARWARRLARRRFLARDGWTPHARTAWQACNTQCLEADRIFRIYLVFFGPVVWF